VTTQSELSIFVDESGDFGEYQPHSPYYIVTMVFHDQKHDITNQINKLDAELALLNVKDLAVHTGPIIRKEEIYMDMPIEERRRILNKLVAFYKQVDIKHKTFYVHKQKTSDIIEISGNLSRQISSFIRENYAVFLNYNTVKVYYDNGQVELTKLLSTVLNALLNNVEFRKVLPADYKLFQVADLLCTFQLIDLRLQSHTLSSSTLKFFDSQRHLKRNYLRILAKKELK